MGLDLLHNGTVFLWRSCFWPSLQQSGSDGRRVSDGFRHTQHCWVLPGVAQLGGDTVWPLWAVPLLSQGANARSI